jgi:glycosyltransferase involved in cell wall biosynthesis
MKKKVLFLSEAPWYSTGYSVYGNQVLKRLVQNPSLDVAQIAIYASSDDPHVKDFPWKIYGNKPSSNHPQYKTYQVSPSAQFGDFSFNEVLLDFNPHFVLDIRDWWMIEFQQRSPFRNFFKWAIMPTVDAEPQNNQWINTYESADAVFTYSEFGRDVLLNQCDNIKFLDIASPAASECFTPVANKAQHKSQCGLRPDSLIFGTVMRNQKRKLYPDLFESFREFLNLSNRNDVFLYCHTYYPDIGWNIPELLDTYSLSNRVLFTYKCKKCGKITTDFFQDAMQFCKSCGNFTNALVGIGNSITEKELAKIYNIFDVYIQYANSEGFGMPQLEAAYCGLPVVSIYYSAMKSVIDNIGGIGVNPIAFSKECETGCNRAIPNNQEFIDILLRLSEKTKDELKNIGTSVCNKARKAYSWDQTANKWMDYILNTEIIPEHLSWKSPSKLFSPAHAIPEQLTTSLDKVNFIFNNVLGKPEWIGGYLWRRVLRDCSFGYRCENLEHDFYFNESHIQSYSTVKPFSIDEAMKEMTNFRLQMNHWEQARLEKFKIS